MKKVYSALCIALSVFGCSVSALDCCGRGNTTIVVLRSDGTSLELFPAPPRVSAGAVPGRAVLVTKSQDKGIVSLKGLSEEQRAVYWQQYFGEGSSCDSE